MKILWLSHLIPYPPKGGVLQRSYNLINELSKYHDVHLICFRQQSLHPHKSSCDIAIQELEKIVKVDRIFNIKIDSSKLYRIYFYFKSLFSTTGYTVNWLENNDASEIIHYIIKKENIELVHFDTISLVPYLKKMDKIVKVLNHHNIESLMMLRRSRKEKNILKSVYFYLEGRKIQRYEKMVCDKFDLHLTCSKLDAERFKEICDHTNIVEIPNGVDLDYFKPSGKIERDNCTLVFAGGLSWYPNIDAIKFFLDNVWPLIIKKNNNIKFYIIGRNPPKWLKELALKDERLIVTGFVEDVRPYIEKATLYVCPIRDGGGTKLKILDALAMNKAIISDPIACEGIDVVDGENIIFAKNAEQYCNKIIEYLDNHDAREYVENNARKLIEDKYSYHKIGQKMSDLYLKYYEPCA